MTARPHSNHTRNKPTGIVVIAEETGRQIRPVVYEVIAFARKLQSCTGADSIKVLLLSDKIENQSRELAEQSGLDVVEVQIPEMDCYSGEVYLQALTDILPEMQPV